MRCLTGIILLLVSGCGVQDNTDNPFTEENTPIRERGLEAVVAEQATVLSCENIALTEEQIHEFLERRTGQWKVEGAGASPKSASFEATGISVARWKEKGRSIEIVGINSRRGETTYFLATVTFDSDLGVFVQRTVMHGITIVSHRHWNPNTRKLVITRIAPPLPSGVKFDFQAQLIDAQTTKLHFKVFENETEVFSESSTGIKIGPIDNARFEALLSSFQKQQESMVRDP